MTAVIQNSMEKVMTKMVLNLLLFQPTQHNQLSKTKKNLEKRI
jgi:hypothetical protein